MRNETFSFVITVCPSIRMEHLGFHWTVVLKVLFLFFFQCHHMSFLVDFVVLPPGHGRNVTDFSGWDAHEAQLRCPDGVSGDIGRCSARRGLKPKFY